MDIDISGISKAQLLASLYNNTRPRGLGFLLARPGDMSEQEAQTLIEQHDRGGMAWFDYVHGRPLKVGFQGDMLLRADLYDRDAPGGDGTAQRLVDAIRASLVVRS